MKKIFLYSLLILLAYSCGQKKTIYGTIPIGVEPLLYWEEKGSGEKDWDLIGKIPVFLENGTVDSCYFNCTSGLVFGKILVEYRNVYPRAKNKEIRVELECGDTSKVWIRSASVKG